MKIYVAMVKLDDGPEKTEIIIGAFSSKKRARKALADLMGIAYSDIHFEKIDKRWWEAWDPIHGICDASIQAFKIDKLGKYARDVPLTVQNAKKNAIESEKPVTSKKTIQTRLTVEDLKKYAPGLHQALVKEQVSKALSDSTDDPIVKLFNTFKRMGLNDAESRAAILGYDVDEL